MKTKYDPNLINKIAYLIRKGKATAEEKSFFECWYNDQDNDSLEVPEGYIDNVDVLKSRMHAQVMHEIKSTKKPKSIINQFPWKFTIAAAIVLVFLFVGYKFISIQIIKDVNLLSSDFNIKPGKNAATLTLADGQVIVLSDVESGRIALEGNMSIYKTIDGRLMYESNSNFIGEDLLNTVSTSRGETYSVTLPDGTQVWLNSESSVKYPVAFSSSERIIELHGEAYFEVKPNKEIPFKVKSSNQVVEVLGTSFNVSAYSDESMIKTTLVEGSVRVQYNGENIQLAAGQQAQVRKQNQTLHAVEADIEEAIAWKNGYFRFKDETIGSVMRKIARWYNVDVVFRGNITKEKFNGTISRSKEIEEVIEMLEATRVLHLNIEEGRVIVMD